MSEEDIYDVDRNAEEATTTTNTLGINSNNHISTLGNDAKHQELMEAMEAISLMLKQTTNNIEALILMQKQTTNNIEALILMQKQIMQKQIMQTMNKADNNINPSGDNEDVLPPPVKTSSALDEFVDKHSGLFLSLAAVSLLVYTVCVILSIVIVCQDWSHNKALSLFRFRSLIVASPSALSFGCFCYKRRARIWNFFGYQIDDNNHRYTIAAEKKSK
ncbi:unnamed protein product [[Candida] boidinii]|nr:unnamed protein product [[Candida] boidinii]